MQVLVLAFALELSGDKGVVREGGTPLVPWRKKPVTNQDWLGSRTSLRSSMPGGSSPAEFHIPIRVVPSWRRIRAR